jgi:hypothetical protein
VIPSPIDAIDGYQGGVVDATAHPGYDPARLTTTLSALAAEAGLPCIDLYGPFRERGAAVFLRYPDAHWNAAGQELAARVVGERIVADRTLAASRDGR